MEDNKTAENESAEEKNTEEITNNTNSSISDPAPGNISDNAKKTTNTEVTKEIKLRADLEHIIATQTRVIKKQANKNLFWAVMIFVVGLLFFIVPANLLYEHSKSISFTSDKTNNSETVKLENTTPKETKSESIDPASVKAEITKAEMKNSTLNNAVIVSIICGVLIEITALIIFYFYGRTLNQLDMNFDMNYRFLLANSVCDCIEGDAKKEGQIILIKALVGYEPEKKEQPKADPTSNNTQNT